MSDITVKIAPLPRGNYSSTATYAKLDVVSYNGSSYMAIKAVPTGTVPTNTTYWQLLAEKPTIGEGSITTDMLADGAVTADKLDSSVSEVYAEVSGTYEDMVVGSAEQLLSTQYDTDSVPYAFRKSPYGDREFDEIHGGTIAWNQLLKNFNTDYWSNENGTTSSFSDGVVTMTTTVNSNGIRANYRLWINIYAYHKYLLSVDIKSATAYTNVGFGITGSGMMQRKYVVGDSAWHTYASVIEATSTASDRTTYFFRSAGTMENVQAKNPMIIDLTQMFGSAIADYIYSLEQANAGAGVAWFKSLFPKPYYAYNAGQLISVSGLSAHKTTGFNQWDEQWRIGEYDMANGSFVTDSTHFASKNPIPVQPNTTYYLGSSVNATFRVFYYDADKQFVGFEAIGTTNSTFTTISTAHYIQFSSTTGFYGTTYKHDICINISGERDGEYERYEVHEYALDSSLTLRGVPKLVDNKMQFDGDVYANDGTVQRKYGIVDLGTLTWEAWTGYAGVYRTPLPSNCKTMPNNNTLPNWIAPIYKTVIGVDISSNNKTIGQLHQTYLVVHDDSYSNASTFKTAMDGVYLVFELATPTTESASPYVNPQICNEYGTEEYISAEQSGVTMIVGHNTKYPQNLRKKIEGLPWNFSNLIAPTEVTNKASRNYTVGSFLIMNNTLYKVTSAIANGGTITVGSNVSATTIMQEILAL